MYTVRDRTRLVLILRGKRLGFSLAEIAEIIDMYDAPPGELGQLRTLLGRIGEHRADLEARRDELDRTIAEFDDVADKVRTRLAELLGDNGA